MESDLEIARRAEMLPIEGIASQLGLSSSDLLMYGSNIAKVSWDAVKPRIGSDGGSLVLVTSVSPTAFGEGKTLTTIGLTQGMNAIGKNASCVIREPSMGPVFGIKGGAAGGGHSQVLPMEQVNLHFTGDLHAVTSAHNLCSAMIDNHLHRGNELGIRLDRIFWPRTIDMNDRSLRVVEIGRGGDANGVVRTDRFDITAASELMAILALSKNFAELRDRVGRVIIGETGGGNPVTADDLGAAGAMTLLLRDSLMPNLVQTLEGNPAFIHCGPFANIAHGNSSIIADEVALSGSEYVVTEAGFGAEMGAEKALQIKAEASGRIPDCIVLNATVRSMKMHGGGFSSWRGGRPDPEEVSIENVDAVRKGASTNLSRHLSNLIKTEIPIVVSINKFNGDTDDEINAISEEAKRCGAMGVVVCEAFAKGGSGAIELARSVSEACQRHVNAGRPYTPLVEPGLPIEETIAKIAVEIYGADGVELSEEAVESLETLRSWGLGSIPVCMAKTQYSFSHDPRSLGSPSGFTLPIREIRVNAGAGFVVAVCGSMMTMPGLPSRPAASDMDMNEEGELTGVFS
ncbi:MAG: formate--tetrahydrofolate ligase [Candidatus Thermoplasmatota archaeon]|nr:formate--tetrahydrofolate ligase [Candidatus Thermoplasmatota archaeon]